MLDLPDEKVYNNIGGKVMNLRDTLKAYTDKDPARFHMPGHKGMLCPDDITELSFSDDLHHPTGVIADLQKRCSSLYGADDAFLLVNGSSAGVCAMLCALALKLKRPPRVLVGRDCHKSIISAAFLSGALLCGVYPEAEIFGTLTLSSLQTAFRALPETPDCVFITSPNYYGMCADVAAICNFAHENGAYLFVDCAHGAHFPLSDSLPPVPVCDAFCVSAHKTLPALNQTGILLSCSELSPYMNRALDMLQTTSPSYPLMASIEGAIETEYATHMRRIEYLRSVLAAKGIRLAEKPASAAYSDPTRICILAENGYKLGAELEKHGIYVEMSDLFCTVLITSPCDKDEWYERLISALSSLHGETRTDYAFIRDSGHYEYCDVRAAMLSESEKVNIRDAEGRAATECFGIYPPGISCVFPGERIEACVIEGLLGSIAAGGRPFGTDGKTISVRRKE